MIEAVVCGVVVLVVLVVVVVVVVVLVVVLVGAILFQPLGQKRGCEETSLSLGGGALLQQNHGSGFAFVPPSTLKRTPPKYLGNGFEGGGLITFCFSLPAAS